MRVTTPVLLLLAFMVLIVPGGTMTATLRANISETVLVLLINEQGEKEKGRDEREFSRCCSFPRDFGWRGTERRRAKRAAAQCSGSQSGGPLPVGRAA